VLNLCRTVHRPRPSSVRASIDDVLAQRIHQLIQTFPTWGFAKRTCLSGAPRREGRRGRAWLKHHEGLIVNKKTVYRIFRLKRWFVNQRQTTPRPRAKASRSVAAGSNERWAMGVTHVHCGKDGWGVRSNEPARSTASRRNGGCD
jgi:hypothetical protein